MKVQKNRFTLVEMLVVLIIALLLAGIILAANAKIQEKAETSKATAQIKKIEVAMDHYYQDYGQFPENGTNADQFDYGELTMNELNKLRDMNGKLYVDWETEEGMNNANDPWGNPYVLYVPGTMNEGSYDVWSRGPDGKHGNNGSNEAAAQTFSDNDDLTNWKN